MVTNTVDFIYELIRWSKAFPSFAMALFLFGLFLGVVISTFRDLCVVIYEVVFDNNKG